MSKSTKSPKSVVVKAGVTSVKPSVAQILSDDAAFAQAASKRDARYAYHKAYNDGTIRNDTKSVKTVGATKWIVYIHYDGRNGASKGELKYRKAQTGEDISQLPAFDKALYPDHIR